MPEDTADIVGTKNSQFTITLDSGTIVRAKLLVDGQDDKLLNIEPSKKEVTVDSLPEGDSSVEFDLFWPPGDGDAIVDIGKVISGSVEAVDPKKKLRKGKTPGFAGLFGRAS